MGFRFRKSFKVMPGVRLNVGKTGSSISLGRRGATVNISKKGTRTTVGLPGTGISYSKYRKYKEGSGTPLNMGVIIIVGFILVLFLVSL